MWRDELTDGQTERHDGTQSHFRNFAKRLKTSNSYMFRPRKRPIY